MRSADFCLYGQVFKCLVFTNAVDANEYMKNSNYGVLAEVGDNIYLADVDDKGRSKR